MSTSCEQYKNVVWRRWCNRLVSMPSVDCHSSFWRAIFIWFLMLRASPVSSALYTYGLWSVFHFYHTQVLVLGNFQTFLNTSPLPLVLYLYQTYKQNDTCTAPLAHEQLRWIESNVWRAELNTRSKDYSNLQGAHGLSQSLILMRHI